MSTMTEPSNVSVAIIDRALTQATQRGADTAYVNTLLDMRNWYARLEATA